MRREAGGAGDLADRRVALAAARGAGLALKHRLGQHLLIDRGVLEAIVDALAPGSGDDVLEVGPGVGTLTVELGRRGRRVVAVELDPACALATRRATAGLGTVTVVDGDVLGTDPATLGLGPGWLAAGNIPYTITGALVEHLMTATPPPARAVLLVQREVARRLASGPGGWSLATVAVRSVADAEQLLDVPPEAFEPPPRVHSSVLRLTPRPRFGDEERRRVLAVARACFQLRRKLLRHGVTRACAGDPSRAALALELAAIEPGRRPGELDLEEWRRLSAAVAAAGTAR